MVPLLVARKKTGLTQRKLAKATGIAQATLSRKEKDGKPVTGDQAEKLARYFGFPWTEVHFLYPERFIDFEDVA